MFENIGPVELLIIVFVIMILFGGKKIPEIAQGLGKGIREFKKSLKDNDDEIEKSDEQKKSDNS